MGPFYCQGVFPVNPAGLETTILAFILSLAAGTPLVMAALCCTPLQKRVIRFLPLSTVPALFIALAAPGDTIVEVGWFFMGGRMGIDETGRIFLSISAFVWLLASFSIRSLPAGDNDRARFYIFFLAR